MSATSRAAEAARIARRREERAKLRTNRSRNGGIVTEPWAPGELALVAGWEVEGAWFGYVLKETRATGVVVKKGDEKRIIFFDHKIRQLRSVPFPVEPWDIVRDARPPAVL